MINLGLRKLGHRSLALAVKVQDSEELFPRRRKHWCTYDRIKPSEFFSLRTSHPLPSVSRGCRIMGVDLLHFSFPGGAGLTVIRTPFCVEFVLTKSLYIIHE